jgi:hypothetical protein
MDNGSSLGLLPLGLIEIDPAGTVIYYKPETDGQPAPVPLELVGRNLFTDVAPVAHAREFQDLVKNFRRSHAPAASYDFTFALEDGHTAPVRVLLARIHEKRGYDSTESLFVHLRATRHRIAA